MSLSVGLIGLVGLVVPPPVQFPSAQLSSPMVQQFTLPHARQVDRSTILFPSESVTMMPTTLLADTVARTPEEEAEAKGRAPLILGVIVANSIFWQYVLPFFKGQPTSTGRKKK